jgi:hypothetical protein
LAGEWNALLDRAATRVPFLRYEVQSLWWSSLGGGEWPSGELWLGTARDEHGVLQGLCPLFQPGGPHPDGRLHLIGSFEISDYLDLIVPTQRSPIWPALLSHQAEPSVTGLDLYNLRRLRRRCMRLKPQPNAAGNPPGSNCSRARWFARWRLEAYLLPPRSSGTSCGVRCAAPMNRIRRSPAGPRRRMMSRRRRGVPRVDGPRLTRRPS